MPAEEVKDPDAKADEAEKVKEAEVKELQEEIKLAQMTEEQLNRVLAYGNTIAEVKTAMDKQFGTAFGKMGGLERVIKDLQAATPVGQPITVTEADLTELKDEFPDLSKKLATGLTRVLSKFKGTGTAESPATFDPNTVIPLVEERVKVARREIREELSRDQLSDLHENWQAIVGEKDSNTEYRQWLLKQPVAYQNKIANSWSPFVVAHSIDQFLEAQEKAKKPAEKPADTDKRKARLAEAVPQRGQPGVKATKSDQEEFEAGFKDALKN